MESMGVHRNQVGRQATRLQGQVGSLEVEVDVVTLESSHYKDKSKIKLICKFLFICNVKIAESDHSELKRMNVNYSVL